MCGILGYIGNIPQHAWPEAHTLLSNIFLKSVLRGSDAAGFSAIHDIDNPLLVTEKRPISSIKLIKRSAKYRALRKYMPKFFIGHTRFSTSGHAKRNRNNHPFNSSRYSLVHNGGITDWRGVIPKIGLSDKMRTGCDSEMLIHLMEEKESINNGVQHMMDSIPGSSRVAIATLQHHADLEKRLWLFRNNTNKIYIMTVPQWGTIFFASTDTILDDSMKMTYGDNLKNVIKKYNISKAELPAWHLMEFGFDDNVAIPLSHFDIEERKMGFTQQSATQTSITSGSSNNEFSTSSSNQRLTPPSRRLPLGKVNSNDATSIINDKDITIEMLDAASPDTKRDVLSVALTAQESIPILRALRQEPMMQNIELDHFKKWMMRPV